MTSRSLNYGMGGCSPGSLRSGRAISKPNLRQDVTTEPDAMKARERGFSTVGYHKPAGRKGLGEGSSGGGPLMDHTQAPEWTPGCRGSPDLSGLEVQKADLGVPALYHKPGETRDLKVRGGWSPMQPSKKLAKASSAREFSSSTDL